MILSTREYVAANAGAIVATATMAPERNDRFMDWGYGIRESKCFGDLDSFSPYLYSLQTRAIFYRRMGCKFGPHKVTMI